MLFSRSSKDRGGSSVRPNVSITPISDSSVTIGDTESSKNRGVATTGIEIIPLGAALTTGAGSQLKSKVPFHLRIIFDRSRGCLSHRLVYQGAWLEAQPVRGRQEAVGQEGEEEEGGEGEGGSCCWIRCALSAWHHWTRNNEPLKWKILFWNKHSILFRRAWAQQVTGSDRAAWWGGWTGGRHIARYLKSLFFRKDELENIPYVQGIEITPASVGKERAAEPNVEISLDRFNPIPRFLWPEFLWAILLTKMCRFSLLSGWRIEVRREINQSWSSP